MNKYRKSTKLSGSGLVEEKDLFGRKQGTLESFSTVK